MLEKQADITVSSVEEFLTEVRKVTHARLRNTVDHYLFRGQEDAGWEISSGCARKIDLNNPDKTDGFYQYHTHLIDEAMLNKHHERANGTDLTQLELLAELQHNGAATGLIDFTQNSLVALWFACQFTCDDARDKDAAVFILDTSGQNFQRISSSNIQQKIEDILRFEEYKEANTENPNPIATENLYWIWKPAATHPRMLVQNSFFIFGHPCIDPSLVHKIKIRNEQRQEILDDLAIRFGIKYDTIYPDIQGFSEYKSASHKQSFVELRSMAIKDSQQGNYETAINRYEQHLKQKTLSTNEKALLNLGWAETLLASIKTKRSRISTDTQDIISRCNEIFNLEDVDPDITAWAHVVYADAIWETKNLCPLEEETAKSIEHYREALLTNGATNEATIRTINMAFKKLLDFHKKHCRNRTEAIIEILDQLVDKMPNKLLKKYPVWTYVKTVVLYNRAKLYMQCIPEKLDKAIADFEHALKISDTADELNNCIRNDLKNAQKKKAELEKQ